MPKKLLEKTKERRVSTKSLCSNPCFSRRRCSCFHSEFQSHIPHGMSYDEFIQKIYGKKT